MSLTSFEQQKPTDSAFEKIDVVKAQLILRPHLDDLLNQFYLLEASVDLDDDSRAIAARFEAMLLALLPSVEDEAALIVLGQRLRGVGA